MENTATYVHYLQVLTQVSVTWQENTPQSHEEHPKVGWSRILIWSSSDKVKNPLKKNLVELRDQLHFTKVDPL